jgi:hypothetical protein
VHSESMVTSRSMSLKSSVQIFMQFLLVVTMHLVFMVQNVREFISES